MTSATRLVAALGAALALALFAAGCNSANGSYKLTAPMMTIRAGEMFPLTVTAVDKSGKTMTNYLHMTKLSSDDGTPEPTFTFMASEQGVHMVGVTINKTGMHTITASEVGNDNFNGKITVNVQSGLMMVMTGIDPSVTTSTPLTAHLQLVDSAGNVAPDYTGTVAFTASDSVAYLPAQYTFTAADAGQHDFTVTFNTVGAQMVNATDTVTTAITASANTNVSGPAYYYVDPPAGGKIRLVHDAPMSSPTVAVLDLVAATDLMGYFVGFDVAIDASKLTPGADLVTVGPALNPGSSPAAVAGAIPTAGPLANVLASGVSQKASGAGAVTTDATIPSGTVFYTLKLPIKSGAAGGTLMDGTVAKNLIRAGLRNRVGTEVVGVADFAVGKLVYTP